MVKTLIETGGEIDLEDQAGEAETEGPLDKEQGALVGSAGAETLQGLPLGFPVFVNSDQLN